jgi:hypothetical protein
MRRFWPIVVVVAAHFVLSVSFAFACLYLGLLAMFGGARPIFAAIAVCFFHIFYFPLALAARYGLPGLPGLFELILVLANSTLCGISGLSLWRWWRKRSSRAVGGPHALRRTRSSWLETRWWD